jgi:diguanylate cyclase (GGDEF)-like protein/PAS domain S-box-containing protein
MLPMRVSERADSLDAETQRLENWYLLLGELSNCLWYPADLPEMLNGFCRILVQRAGYRRAEMILQTALQTERFCAESLSDEDVPSQPPADALSLELHLAHDLSLLLNLHASFDLNAGSEARLIIERFVQELKRAIYALRHTHDHHDLQENLELLSLMMRQSPFSVLITDAQGRLQYCNETYTQRSGYALSEQAGQFALWNLGDGTDARHQAEFTGLRMGQQWHGDVLSRSKNGQRYWERQVVSPLGNEQGEVTHLVAFRQELSERQFKLKEVEQALLLREQALVSSSNGIMITRSDDSDHSIVYVNPAFERITGYAADEVIGREGRFLVREDLQQPDLEEIRSALREKREGRALLRNYRKDGTQFWNELHISPVKDTRGAITTHFVSVINDVSERVNYQKELEYQATHDSLTGLANRNLLNDRINQAIAWAKRQNLHVGLMLIDLDHFKLINDASGHGAGDEMLKQVAQRLSQCVRDTDTVARLGGDEFVIVLTDLPEIDDVDTISAKVMHTLTRPMLLGGQEIFVSASIGISVYPRDGDHGETLLRYADIAMYRVKEHGRNSVRQFVPEMGVSAISRLNMEGAMRRGLEKNEFTLYFQPKVDLLTDQVIGAEALVRWNHPQIGLVHPGEFIPLAEETGLILQLGEWVLTEACHQQLRWTEMGYGQLHISVNMSSRQFRQEDLASRIAAIMETSGVDPHRITLELTESMVMQDVGSALTTLRALKNLGLTISLDDFGTGYSSLSYLRRFPIDELKIDKSFINDIHVNPDDAAIASAIIAMGLSLGLKVVAEGVEKAEQVHILRSMQCTEVQGYYFARPMNVSHFEKYLIEQRVQKS